MKYLKDYYSYLFLAFLIFMVLVVSTTSSIDIVKPYNMYSPISTYEGLHDMSSYTNLDTNTSYALDNYLINRNNKSNCHIGKHGSLACNPNDNGIILENYSLAHGSLACNESSQMSNSRGPLCLSKKMIQLLQTRGGNSTCPDSQIGSSYV
jgi:hypothetical protein